MQTQKTTGGAAWAPPPKGSLYEVTTANGETWQIEAPGELGESDLAELVRGIQERPAARVDQMTFRGGAGAHRLPQSAKESLAGKAPTLFDKAFGLDKPASPESVALQARMQPVVDDLRGTLSAPFRTVGELADIAKEAGSDLAHGRPVMRTNGGAVPRLQDMALGMIPLYNEGRAAFVGSENQPGARGLPAAWDQLTTNFSRAPISTVANLALAGGALKSPLLRDANGVSRSLMTSAETSAIGRQGALLGVTNPRRVAPALSDMALAMVRPGGAEEVAARARRPIGAAPTLADMGAPPAPRVPTGEPTLAGPGRVVPGVVDPVPQAPPLGVSDPSRRTVVQTRPGVYRVASEMLDELLAPPVDAGAALKRATRTDALAPVKTPGEVALPATGSPALVPQAPASKSLPSPEAYGLDLSSSELYRGSQLAEKIPIIGKVVEKSRIGFDAYMNSLKRGAWDDAAANLEKQGYTPETHPEVFHSLGRWISRAGGTGDASMIPPAVADAMFAPRLTASRLELLNPYKYEQLSAPVRRMALQQVATATAAGLGTLYLASRVPGVKVGTDPEDAATFGKITLPDGKTHYEVFAGFTPYARLAALALSGSEKTGQVAGTRAESMLSPLHSLALSAFRGRTITGENFEPLSETGARFVPLVVQDMNDAVLELGPRGILTASPSILGVGVQTYQKKGK